MPFTVYHAVQSCLILLFILSLRTGEEFSFVRAEDPRPPRLVPEHEGFVQAMELLERAQFKQALQSLNAAVAAEPENERYVAEYEMLRKVVETRASIQTEKSLHRWNIQAKLLYSYYLRKQLHVHLLDMGRRIFDRQPNPWNAILLADGYLLAGRPEDALDTLDLIEMKEPIPQVLLIRGAAVMATGNRAEAQKLARSIDMGKIADAGILYRLAVLRARTGLNRSAVQTLVLSFEKTPVCFLEDSKERAKKEPAFQGILDAPEFQAALKVQSTVRSPFCERNADYVPDQNRKPVKPVNAKIDLEQWGVN
ncbi:MAG TPA: hypothetical protein DEB39_13645 [Planctomycetaceae bacterium]|nr:hypothetical protein [Planctomycetaceae bacterium]